VTYLLSQLYAVPEGTGHAALASSVPARSKKGLDGRQRRGSVVSRLQKARTTPQDKSIQSRQERQRDQLVATAAALGKVPYAAASVAVAVRDPNPRERLDDLHPALRLWYEVQAWPLW
jgi:hypothetical protein